MKMEVDSETNPLQDGLEKEVNKTPVKLCDFRTFLKMDTSAFSNGYCSPTATTAETRKTCNQEIITSPHSTVPSHIKLAEQNNNNFMLLKNFENTMKEKHGESLKNDIADLEDIDKTIQEFTQQDQSTMSLNDVGNQVVPDTYTSSGSSYTGSYHSDSYDDSGSSKANSPLMEHQFMESFTKLTSPPIQQQQQFTFMQELQGEVNQQGGHLTYQTQQLKSEVPDHMNFGIQDPSVSSSGYLLTPEHQRSQSKGQKSQLNLNNNSNRLNNNPQPILNFNVKNEDSDLFHHFKLPKDKNKNTKLSEAVPAVIPAQQETQQLPQNVADIPGDFEEEEDGFDPDTMDITTASDSGPPKSGGYPCRYCGKVYNSYQYRWCHERAHIAPKNHHCEICGASFQYLQNLSRHIRQVHKTSRPFKCKECGRCCVSEAELAQHMISTHENVTKGQKKETVICPVCGVEYSKKYYIRVHKKFHKGIRYSCQICGRVFTHPQNMWRHYKLHENPGAYKVGCPKCPMFFKTALTMKRHMDAKHKEDETTSTSAAATASQQSDNQQQNTLNNTDTKQQSDKPFICDVCTKQFASKSALYCHMNVHLKNRNVRKYNLQCGVCKKNYKEWGALKKHCEVNHNGDGLQENTLRTPVNLKSPYTEVIHNSNGENITNNNNMTMKQDNIAEVTVPQHQQQQAGFQSNNNSDDIPIIYGRVNANVVGNITHQSTPTSPSPGNMTSSGGYVAPYTDTLTLAMAASGAFAEGQGQMYQQQNQMDASTTSVADNATNIIDPNMNFSIKSEYSMNSSNTYSGVVDTIASTYTTSVPSSSDSSSLSLMLNSLTQNTLQVPNNSPVTSTKSIEPQITDSDIAFLNTITSTVSQTTTNNILTPSKPTQLNNITSASNFTQELMSSVINSPISSPQLTQVLQSTASTDAQQLLSSPTQANSDIKKKAGRPKGAKNKKRAYIGTDVFFECNFCDALFKSRGGIKNHEKMHEQLNMTGPLPGKYRGRHQVSVLNSKASIPDGQVQESYPQNVVNQQTLMNQQNYTTNQNTLTLTCNQNQTGSMPDNQQLRNLLMYPNIDMKDNIPVQFSGVGTDTVSSMIQQAVESKPPQTSVVDPQSSLMNPHSPILYICPHCKEQYTDTVSFQNHIALHVQNNIYRSPVTSPNVPIPAQTNDEGLKNVQMSAITPNIDINTANLGTPAGSAITPPNVGIPVSNDAVVVDVKPILAALMKMANLSISPEMKETVNNNPGMFLQSLLGPKLEESNQDTNTPDFKPLIKAILSMANNMHPDAINSLSKLDSLMTPNVVQHQQQSPPPQLHQEQLLNYEKQQSYDSVLSNDSGYSGSQTTDMGLGLDVHTVAMSSTEVGF